MYVLIVIDQVSCNIMKRISSLLSTRWYFVNCFSFDKTIWYCIACLVIMLHEYIQGYHFMLYWCTHYEQVERIYSWSQKLWADRFVYIQHKSQHLWKDTWTVSLPQTAQQQGQLKCNGSPTVFITNITLWNKYSSLIALCN